MLLAVRISSYGCTWEVWRALKKLELLSAAPRTTLTLLSCSPNFPRASITRYTHAKHEPILNYRDCTEQLKQNWVHVNDNNNVIAQIVFWRLPRRYFIRTLRWGTLPVIELFLSKSHSFKKNRLIAGYGALLKRTKSKWEMPKWPENGTVIQDMNVYSHGVRSLNWLFVVLVIVRPGEGGGFCHICAI